MAKTNRLLIAALTAGALASPGLAQLRVCTWNVTNFTATTTRNTAFQTAFYGVVPTGLALAGKSMSPDVIIGQEFISQAGVDNFRTLLNTAPGSPGDWASVPFLDGADTDSAFFYRTTKVEYVQTVTVAIGSSSVSNQPRDTRRYDFRPIGYSATASTVAAYSVHLKAQGSNTAPPGENAQGRRLVECQRIRANAETLPAGHNFLMAGDTNIQTSIAVDYQELVGSKPNNVGRLFDPINSPSPLGAWNNNSAFRFIHTQEPASQMDDRHDQILISSSLFDGVGMDYIGVTTSTYSTTTWNDPNHSYRCWGNDGSSFDVPLTTTGNTMVGPAIAQALITSVAGNGHMPVIADFKVPAKAAANPASSIAFGTVNQNAVATQTLTMTNSGDTAKWTITGIANLKYYMTITGGFTVTSAGTVGSPNTEAPGGGFNSHTVAMPTGAPGPRNGTLTIFTDAPETPTITITLSGNVVVPPPVCPADIGIQGGTPGHDGFLDNNDFVAFISLFFAHDSRADFGMQGGEPGQDTLFDNNDFVVFISAFFAGCTP